jgi:hypothetical protein
MARSRIDHIEGDNSGTVRPSVQYGLTMRESYPLNRRRAGDHLPRLPGFAHWAFSHRPLARRERNQRHTFDFSGRNRTGLESFTEEGAFAGNTFSQELRDIDLVADYARRRNGSIAASLFDTRGGGMAILLPPAKLQ